MTQKQELEKISAALKSTEKRLAKINDSNTNYSRWLVVHAARCAIDAATNALDSAAEGL